MITQHQLSLPERYDVGAKNTHYSRYLPISKLVDNNIKKSTRTNKYKKNNIENFTYIIRGNEASSDERNA